MICKYSSFDELLLRTFHSVPSVGIITNYIDISFFCLDTFRNRSTMKVK
jgi:hypothetical protein